MNHVSVKSWGQFGELEDAIFACFGLCLFVRGRCCSWLENLNVPLLALFEFG